MQATPNGEFYPEKNLDKNYKIPRKQSDMSVTDAFRSETSNPSETPLADSYYNYPYDPAVASSYYQEYPDFRNMPPSLGRPSGTFEDSILAPPPPPPPLVAVDPIQQNIFNMLKDIKEKPKTYGRNIFEQTVPDLLDDSLPKDLKVLFQPLFCKLCSAQLSSNQTAKLHYKSKNHEKKIRKWLTEWSERTGEPLSARALVSNSKKDDESQKNPAWFYCDICDLKLTGKLHAESHYMGKNHLKVSLGYKEGKLIRSKGQKSKVFNFEKGEDNFGSDFKTAWDATEAPDSGEPVAKKRKKEAQPASKFRCETCQVNATCQDQLEAHYRGQKHIKKLKQLGLDANREQRKLTENSGSVPEVATTCSVVNAIDPNVNLTVHRMPSGDYYCPKCNLTTNSMAQFMQHMKSKGHAKKSKG